MNKQIFNEIGLTDSERKVYLALLELGDSTRNDIVNKSQVAGSKVYELLEKLQEKGLVSIYTKNKVKHFKPINPKQILNYLENKKQEINKVEQQTKNILPELLLKFNSSKEQDEVELISGIKGLEIIFREQTDALNKNDTCYVIGGTWGEGDFDETIIQSFFQKIVTMREKKGIKTKMLFNIEQKDVTKKVYPPGKYPHMKIKYIKYVSPVTINIYNDITIIIIFGKQISSIYIKSQNVASSFMEYFNLLWK